MTTMPISLGGVAGLLAPTRSTARSEPATELTKLQEDVRRHLLTSFAISNAAEGVLAELDEVRAEASRDGWNGPGTLPLNPFAYEFAKLFLTTLPTTAPLPEVSADNDGEVSLDWIFGSRRALSVSVGPTGRCTFAWVQGLSTVRGTDWIDDEIPAPIIHALGRLETDSSGTKSR
jgi:hypothetical protein